MKYSELPISDRTRREVTRGKRKIIIEGRPVVLLCQVCLGQFSATRGDYFMRDQDSEIRHCGRAMKLIRFDAVTHHDVTAGELAELKGGR